MSAKSVRRSGKQHVHIDTSMFKRKKTVDKLKFFLSLSTVRGFHKNKILKNFFH